MQFVKNGPDVPERLLQAHEDGRVVLFCGAGISYPAGLPGFAGLVERIYDKLNIEPDIAQQAAIKAKNFDRAIGLLESGVVGGRETVRRALAAILTPDPGAPNATATHEALLTLSRYRDGRTRLITTNFDRLFEAAVADKNVDIERFQAPLLPVPKSRWDGLVYLHGLLSANPTARELDRLVVSSGDFGLAYLTERWASRFVGELFRNHIVCFVGYSIDDPVLRYMTDALAAGRLLGESPLEMFAFGSYSKGKGEARAGEWKAKNVTPILYREHGRHRYRRHQYLHGTLREWANTYRDGVRGKESIVAAYAGLRPLASTKQDDFVGRVLWALSDPSGLPAKRFADLDPVPSLDWLEPLREDRYRQADLNRFGVPPRHNEDSNLAFSLVSRPSPYTRSPWMALVVADTLGNTWDNVMFSLARWLVRHLDDPVLVLWLTERSGRLHREFAERIEWRLSELDGLERDDQTDELNRIRDNAPRAIPRPAMRAIWRLLLTGRVGSSSSDFDIYLWRDRFVRDGLTAARRLELRDMLTPRVSLRQPFRWGGDREDLDGPERLEDLMTWDIVLSSNHVQSALHDLRESSHWAETLPDLLDDFSALLRDAMDLTRELGGADDREDRSFIHQPSIDDHPQNRRFRDWTALIELTRDAWLATAGSMPERARHAAEAWCFAPYPVFRRLAFFAATRADVIPPRRALDWLLADDRWWLWSMETQREVIRLLVALAPKLDAESLAELEQAVLAGPPRIMFKEDLEDERWRGIVGREVWLRLAKMDDASAVLGMNARERLNELTSGHPEWRLEIEERDEFPFWMGDGGESRRFAPTPRRRRQLAAWLERHPEGDNWRDDDWSQRCRDDFPTTACALCALARNGTWPTVRWREALQAWSEEKLIARSWRHMAPMLTDAPDEVLQSLAHGIGWWLGNVAKTCDPGDMLFLELCRRILALDHQDDTAGDSGDSMTRAINHPVGLVTEALLHWWSRSPLEDGQTLPNDLSPIFTELCDAGVGKFRHGRVLLAARVVTLFRVDREWADRHLLPLFDWRHGEAEARAAWKGFLWSPRLHRPLMESIKSPFLDTANYYEALDGLGEQYATFLTYTALDRGDTFNKRELATATGTLPDEALKHAADTLVRGLEGAGGRRAEYWHNRVLWYLRSIWPRSRDRRTPAISESLGGVCVAAQEAFPEALNELEHWLQPPQYPGHLIFKLKKSELSSRFPEPALHFLDRMTGDEPPWSNDLKDCLEQIRTADPRLEEDRRFLRLGEILRSFGHELE